MNEENWREILLAKADAYCSKAEIKETYLGVKIVNDANFFPNLRKGGGCTADTLFEVKEWFKINPPKKRSRRK